MKILFYTLPINERFYAEYAKKGLIQNGHEVIDIIDENSNIIKERLDPNFVRDNVDLIMFHGFSFMNHLLHQNVPFLPAEANKKFVVFWYDNPLRYHYHLMQLSKFNMDYAFFVCDSKLSKLMDSLGLNVHFSPCMFDPDIQFPGDVNKKFSYQLAFAGSVFNGDTLQKNRFGLTIFEKYYLSKANENRTIGKYFDYVNFLFNNGIVCTNESFGKMAFVNLMEQKHLLRMELFNTLCDYFKIAVAGKGDYKPEHPNIIKLPYMNQHKELPDLYRSAKIQLTVELLPASVHQRIMEVSGCGGFILCEEKDDMRKCFSDELCDKIIWKDLNELKDMCDFYLNNENERLRLSSMLHSEAMEKHNCKVRMREVMEKIKG
jgi:hypothetical protein